MPMLVMLPSQYADQHRKRHEDSAAVRRLMAAVLEEAIRCLCGQTWVECDEYSRSRRGKLAREARAWFIEQDTEWLFGFGTICDVLGCNPEALRERVFDMGRGAAAVLPRVALHNPGHQCSTRVQEART
jgi:hypothetical protein